VLETISVTEVFCDVGGMLDMFEPQPAANVASNVRLMASKDLERRELGLVQMSEAGDFMYPPGITRMAATDGRQPATDRQLLIGFDG
jgi:hypothetical protein